MHAEVSQGQGSDKREKARRTCEVEVLDCAVAGLDGRGLAVSAVCTGKCSAVQSAHHRGRSASSVEKKKKRERESERDDSTGPWL